tara:strand:- start:49 stop:249 length:201 start_codon:yes stop_codon:yes gene_type:complete
MVEDKLIARKRVAKFILLSFLFLIILVMFLAIPLNSFIQTIIVMFLAIIIGLFLLLIFKCISILTE